MHSSTACADSSLMRKEDAILVMNTNSLAYEITNTKTKKQEILEGLNDEQKKVVMNYKGRHAIISGPGSGKTKSMVARTAYMIEDGVPANQILMFTFTRKAANEMKERVLSYIGEKAMAVTVSTYHSFCMKLLRQYADLLDWDLHFTVYDQDDQDKVITQVMRDYQLDRTIKAVMVRNQISHWKEEMLNPKEAHEQAESYEQRLYADIYADYTRELKKNNAFDFDDLIFRSVQILERFPLVRKQVNDHYRYITSDESQDASPRDLRLIELLAVECDHDICCVMDDDQSIYAFRGVKINAVYKFIEKNNFKVDVLSRNYRSTKVIVNAACSLIENNKDRFKKNLFTENRAGARISVTEQETGVKEGRHVAAIINTMVRAGYHYNDIAVLYRMSYLSHDVEDALLKRHIPYEIVKGSAFYARIEVKDLMSYLKFYTNPMDTKALTRALNAPKRYIGEASIERILEFHKNACAAYLDCDTLDMKAIRGAVLAEFKKHACDLKGKAKNGLKQFAAVIESLEEIDGEVKIGEFVKRLYQLSRYETYIHETVGNDEERIANVEKLIDIADTYDTLQEFLDGVMDSGTKEESEAEEDRVHLLTMHASKGLEWPIVIIVDATEGIIPHKLAQSPEEVAEERRLFYVAMTRAKEFLFITHSKTRSLRGQLIEVPESKFLSEINPVYLQRAE